MSVVKPLEGAGRPNPVAEGRGFGLRQSWLHELERAQRELLGKPSPPGEAREPQYGGQTPQYGGQTPPSLGPAAAALTPSESDPDIAATSESDPDIAVAAAHRAAEARPPVADGAAASPARKVNAEIADSAPIHLSPTHPSAPESRSGPVATSASVEAAVTERPVRGSMLAATAAIAAKFSVDSKGLAAANVAQASPPLPAARLPALGTVESQRLAPDARARAVPAAAPPNGSLTPILAPRGSLTPILLEAVPPDGSLTPILEEPAPEHPAQAREPIARRTMHVFTEEGAASVWVRDAALDVPQAQGLTARIAAELASVGKRLAAFTVNGRSIFTRKKGR